MGGLRKLHKENLHNLQILPGIIKMINSRGIRWVGHVEERGEEEGGGERGEERKKTYRLLVGKPEGETTRKTKTCVGG
jgi:hypothetical protein